MLECNYTYVLNDEFESWFSLEISLDTLKITLRCEKFVLIRSDRIVCLPYILVIYYIHYLYFIKENAITLKAFSFYNTRYHVVLSARAGMRLLYDVGRLPFFFCEPYYVP